MNKSSLIYFVLITLQLSTGASHLFAQNSQYQDILSSQGAMSPENYYNALLKFQNENPLWPNVYYKLGNVQLEIFSELDPLVDRSASRQYIANVKTNYSLAKSYVDEKEVRKNLNWYDTPKSKNKDSVVAIVLNKVNQNYLNSIKYEENYEELVINYDKAVKNYLEAREIFIKINNRAENLRQLFLTADNELKTEIKNCGERFDSTIYHLDKYREIYQSMPHKKIRKVNVSLIDIGYYRMNGITPTNFLLDDLELWNYKKWSDNFLKLIEEEVDELKTELSSAYTLFLGLSDKTINGNECFQAKINDLKLQRLSNIVSKYDNQSLLIDIFNYQQAKLNFGNQIVYENNCNITRQAPSDNLISRKARILQNLYESYKSTDSLCTVIGTTNHQTSSFQWFFDKHMAGSNGVQRFSEKQRQENATAIRQNIQKLTSLRDKQFFNKDFTSISAKVVGDTITNQTTVDGEDIEITQNIVLDSLYSIFITNNSKASSSIYGVRKIDKGFRIVWQEKLAASQKPNYYKILSDSSIIIAGTSKSTWLKHLGFLGNKFSDFRITGKSEIENIYYNDLLSSYTVIQKLAYDSVTSKGDYQFIKTNSTGRISLQKKITLNGKFINMISQDSQYWFFSDSKAEENSVINMVTYTWDTMEQTNEYQYLYDTNFKNPIVIKNDNLTLTLIAELESQDNVIYSLIDYGGQKIHEREF